MRRFLSQIAGLFRHARHEREMSEELESHFALHIDDNLRAGIVVGGAGAALAAKSIQALLFEIAPYDGLTFAMAGGAILVSALAAAWLPAARAAGTDPMQVLRAE